MNYITIGLIVFILAAVLAAMIFKPKSRAKFRPHKVKNPLGYTPGIQREPTTTSSHSTSSQDAVNNLHNTVLLSAVLASDSNNQEDRHTCNHSSPSQSYESTSCSSGTSYESSSPSSDGW